MSEFLQKMADFARNIATSKAEAQKNGSDLLQFKNCQVLKDKAVTQIVLPDGMSSEEGIYWLAMHIQSQNEMVSPRIAIKCYPFDGLVAFHRAIKKLFGFSLGSQTVMRSIACSETEQIQVAVGKISMPTIDGHLEIITAMDGGKPAIIITGQVKRSSLDKVNLLAETTKDELKSNSIYKGKAIILGRRNREISEIDKFFASLPGGMAEPPEFMHLNGLKKSDVILNKNTEEQVNNFLWTPIEHSAACRKAGIPLKRGILLHGSYGTGKSLTAAVTAQIAIDNNWTFIHLINSEMLALALEIARWYQPAVIFTEDIDNVVGVERDDDVNDILNVIDGVEKNHEIFVVLTTNNVDGIHKALLRPGRLDALIRFEFPDAEAAARLMIHYGRKLISSDDDLSKAAEIIAGSPASMVRECVERAKLAAIARQGHAKSIICEDLAIAATGLQTHLSLMTKDPNNMTADMKSLGKAMLSMTAELGRRLSDCSMNNQDSEC